MTVRENRVLLGGLLGLSRERDAQAEQQRDDRNAVWHQWTAGYRTGQGVTGTILSWCFVVEEGSTIRIVGEDSPWRCVLTSLQSIGGTNSVGSDGCIGSACCGLACTSFHGPRGRVFSACSRPKSSRGLNGAAGVTVSFSGACAARAAGMSSEHPSATTRILM